MVGCPNWATMPQEDSSRFGFVSTTPYESESSLAGCSLVLLTEMVGCRMAWQPPKK